jgi:hypothetical protein
VHETAEFVPLVQAADVDAIAHADGHALSQVDVVGDEQCLPVADIDDEPLVLRAVVVVTQQAADEARDFDPPPVVAFRKVDASSP